MTDKAIESIKREKYMTFIIDETLYGLDISRVLDIVRLPEITFFPGQPDYVKGMINLRGKIIPTLDMRLKFKKTFRPYDDRTCILVMEVGEIVVGMIVDTIMEVLALDVESITLPKATDKIFENSFIEGISSKDGKSIILLKSDKILEDAL